MWYEILPSFGIIFVAMGLCPAVSYVANKLLIDNHFRRRLDEKNLRLHYMRDTTLTGNPYKVQGLEGIPDN